MHWTDLMLGLRCNLKLIEFRILAKTSLWVINREVWIHGPELPQMIIEYDQDFSHPKQICATAVNSTTVYFFVIGNNGIAFVLTYDFISKFWNILSKNPLIDNCAFPPCMGQCTCTTSQDKSYQRCKF